MYSSLSAPDVLKHLHSSNAGIDDTEAEERRAKEGWNELPEQKKSLFLLFVRQFNDILVYILLAALGLSIIHPFLEHEPISARSFLDAVIIFAILILNAALGFVQEYKAEEAIAGLQKLSAPHARVRRGGVERIIPSRELLPGDIVIIEAGDRISADGRLISESHLEVNESTLTGESLPADKVIEKLEPDLPLADQRNMVSAGTLVTRGSAEYVVTAIGLHSQIGKIAELVSEAQTQQTPLEERMEKLSKLIGLVVLVLCGGLIIMGLANGLAFIDMFVLGVSLAVSAVPEGLPAVVTFCLAMGVRRMTKANVIVRRLPALETLGSVTVICSDKTGTITENRMKVREVWVPATKKDEEVLLVQIAASCNRAQLPNLGDPTEIGLLEEAHTRGVERLPIDDEEVPFTSEEKYIKTKHGARSFLKGAPEKIIALCDTVDEKLLLQQNKAMASNGLRVLACAVQEGRKTRFVGLVGMEDPARQGIPEAVAQAKHAGIRTMMITGDNIDTAMAIAKKVGITGDGIEGSALDALSDEQLRKLVRTTSVYARVSPQHKLRILQALQANREVVAMSGDGVNDAPALKGAHVGVAMGLNGTEVAREASSIVLTDDNYATIVAAVREGRHLYDNIRKFILFLMHCNFYELLFFAVTIALGMPMPYLPIHVLWINLMTDGLPALALGMEGEERDIMNRPPRPRSENIFSGQWGRLTLAAVVPFAISFVLFLWLLAKGTDLDHARTLTFTFAILFEILFTFSIRSKRPFWETGLFGNRWLLMADAIPILLHFVLLYSPLSAAFHLTPITLAEWIVLLLLALAAFFLFELLKLVTPTQVEQKKKTKS